MEAIKTLEKVSFLCLLCSVEVPTTYTDDVKRLHAEFTQSEVRFLQKTFWEHILGESNAKQFLLMRSFAPEATHYSRFTHYTDRLLTGEPYQYILGEVVFGGCTFLLTNDVLIPRPETEYLVYMLVEKLKGHWPGSILDIGVGSGCIAISLKKQLTEWKVLGCDIDENVLEIARSNASKNHQEVAFFSWDVLSEKYPFNTQLDVIVSNPPYIPETEKDNMEANVLEHEPHLALFVPSDHPLVFYKRIITMAESILKPGGWVAFETHFDGAKSVADLFPTRIFTDIEIIKDFDQHERFVFARKSG